MHQKPASPATLPITALSGVGTALAIKLAELDIYRVFDLLMHLPKDYEDRSRTVPMGQFCDGMACMATGTITDVQKTRGGLSVLLTDGTGVLELRFFKTYPMLLQIMTVGVNLTVFGEVKISRYGTQMAHPEYFITGTRSFETGLLPIYPTVKGLQQNKLRQLIKLALSAVAGGQLSGLNGLSDELLAQAGITSAGDLWSALSAIHTPQQTSTA